LAVSTGAAWRESHGGRQAADASVHALISGFEIDLAAGAVALAVGLGVAARLQRRSDLAMAAVVDAFADLAADPDPHRLKPLDASGDLARLAQSYNDVLAGLVRRERQVTLQSEAQAEATRLAELAMLRQDLTAPLATAKSWAAALDGEDAESWRGQRERRTLQALGRIGDSLLTTLDDITYRPHASPNGVQVHNAWTDICEVAEDVGALLWSTAAAKRLDLAVYIDPKTPALIQGDAVRIRQVIGGLAASALAATSEGGVLIEMEPDSATSIRISIHDTGPALAHAPDPRSGGPSLLDEARPGDPEGALQARMATYRQTVRAMGGAFATPARRDRGATFAFRLPAAVAEAATPWAGGLRPRTADGGQADAGAPEDARPPNASALRVLLAVHGPCTRRALSRYLTRAGLVVSMYDGDTSPAGARLLFGDAAGLLAAGPLDIPIVRLVAAEDMAEVEATAHASDDVVLSLPLTRADLEPLLRRINSGHPLQPQARTRASDIASPAGRGVTAMSADERILMADLERAPERGEFSLVYQPQVEREGERILGVEALLRWTHPVRGQVSPAVFIPLAEKAGRVGEVTAWVVDRVLAETQYLSGLQVAFNASALEFADQSFVDRLLAAVAATGYDARRLEVEITETAILHHETPVLESMERLHAAGLGVALDDFGAGYSSLSHLRRYPFDKLKIDREFITDCSRDMESATVVHAVVSIGRALGMKVIAEGVETETQRNFLRIAGVYAMQGYLFGRPAPIDSLAPLIGATRVQARS
jgi:EAL domain-containing protein (putative c-di-GMP-specific phosphodiesterase class I)/signal transduction histidine kinase